MPSSSHSSPLARCIIVALFFVLGFLATVSLADAHAARPPQEQESPLRDEQPEPALEKRLLGMGGVVGIVPSLLGNLVPGGIVSSLVAQVTAEVNTLLPLLDNPSAQLPDGVPLVTGGQAAIPLTAQPIPTGAQLGGLADQLAGLLNSAAPGAASGIIAEITEQAHGVVASVEALATDVVSLGNQISNNQIQAPDALGQIGGLLGSLDSKINDIASGVTSNLAAELPLSVLQNLGQVISSGLGDIVGATDGPLSLVANLVEQNLCGAITDVDGILATVAGLCGDIPSAVAQVSSELATAPLTNQDVTLTGDVSQVTVSPISPTIAGVPPIIPSSTSSPPATQGQGTTGITPTASNSAGGPSLASTENGSTSSPPTQQSTPVASPATSPTNSQIPQPQPSTVASTLGTTGGISPTPTSTLSVVVSPISVSVGGSTSTPLSISSPTGASMPGATGGIPSTPVAGSVQPGQAGTIVTPTTGLIGYITVTDYYTVFQPCTSGVIPAPAVQTTVVTVFAPCATSQCTASPAACNCPNSNPTPPGGNGAKGPCPGNGFTCDDCLDGWFCPPSQTPAQLAPCGFGWPCAHCEGGWFCAPLQTPGPCIGSITPTAVSPGTTAFPSTSFSSPAPGQPSPPPPEKVLGWSYCGCWADDPNQRALDSEVFNKALLTNEDCIQHCMVRGFLTAGTEKGNLCLCGNFLNGTQQMDERVCSIPCAGDPTQMCGGLDALSCYSPDGLPYGWASAGPQLRAPTIPPPEVLELDFGGVAETEIITPLIIFPPETADLESYISVYGKTTSQPLGQLPRDLTFFSSPISPSASEPPFGGGGVAPGQVTPPTTLISGTTPPLMSTPGHGPPPSSTTNGPSSCVPGIDANCSPTATSSNSALCIPGIGVNCPPGPSNSNGNPSPSSTSQPTTGGTTTGPSSSPPSGGSGIPPGQVPPPTTPSPSGNSMTCTPGSSDSNCISSTSDEDIPPSQSQPSTRPPGASSPTCVPGSSDPSCVLSSSSEDVPPSQSQPSTNSPGTGSPTCVPGSSDPSCILSSSSEDVPPSQSQPSTISPSAGSSTCPPGSNDPACTSPVGGGAVAPGQQHPSSSTSSGIPSTCTAGSTDPACISSSGGGNPSPSSSPPSGSTSSMNPTNPTGGPGVPSNTCPPGSTDPTCSGPGHNGSPSPGMPSQGTTPTTSFTASVPTASSSRGSTGPSMSGPGMPSTTNASGSMTLTGETSSVPPGSSTNSESLPSLGPSSTSPPNGGGGVAPGQQNPSTQPSQSNTQVPGTNSNTSPGPTGSITPTETNPSPSSPNPPPGSPGQPTASYTGTNPNQEGSEVPITDSTGPATSYTYPPGVVPYGGGPSPSMRTMASPGMLAWREPDGALGAPTMLHTAALREELDPPKESPEWNSVEVPTPTTASKPSDLRWQRIRPVYVW
ncbi:hypothetical protein F4808DRAFT_457792 [Astrocystis sublimbata]|nr:hypothetical protein F4808DRAFT_457792 [Astrocystis sublimbata]